MSHQQGSSRPPPSLQPKPIAITMRHPVQNVVGRPVIAPMAARGNLTSQTGQQFVVGTVGGPNLIMSQPRMTTQVLQQTPRMAAQVLQQTPRMATQVLQQTPRMAAQVLQQTPRVAAQVLQQNPRVAAQVLQQNPRMTAQVLQQNPRMAAQVLQQNPRMAAQVLQQNPRMAAQVLQQNPRMAAQVLQQQTPRMAMYVPTAAPQGNPMSQNVPKIVAGVPLYQNPIRIQPNTTVTPTGGGTFVRTITSSQAVLQNSNKPSQLTLAPSGRSQAVIQSSSGQLQQLRASAIAGAQFVPTSPGLHIQRANQMQNPSFHYTGGTLQLKEIRPASSVPKVTSPPHIFQVSSAAGTAAVSSSPTQVLAAVTQIPRPKYFTSPTSSPFLTPQNSPTPLSPLVPISPKLFQVSRAIGAQAQVFPQTSISAMQPAMIGFGGQPCTIFSKGQPILNQQTVIVNGVSLNTASTLHKQALPGTPPQTSHSEIQKEKPDTADLAQSADNQKEDEVNQRTAGLSPSDDEGHNKDDNTGDEPTTCDNIKDVPDKGIHQSVKANADGMDDVIEESVRNYEDKGQQDNVEDDGGDDNDDYDDNNDGDLTHEQSKDNTKIPDDTAKPSRENNDEDDGYRIVANFHHDILKLKANTDPDRHKKLEEKQFSSDLNKFKYFSNDGNLSGVDATGDQVVDGVTTAHEDSFTNEMEEDEFVWEEYLQEVGAKAVPPAAFKHVEYSLTNGFVKGMKLEVPNKCDPTTYWVATVLNTCGPLLRLRYDGYDEDTTGDFWCDIATSKIHSIGWCAQSGKNLQPPEKIKDKYEDWKEFLMGSLTGARTAPSYLLDKETGTTPVDQLKCGMRLEIQDAVNPLEVWLLQILENVGGRLFLRLEGTISASKHFWMFYLNVRLHNIGWGKENGCTYCPPKDIMEEHSQEEWDGILETALNESEENTLPPDVFKDQAELKEHRFEVGMKLEALNPAGHNMFSPATVRKVISNKYFIIEMDDLRQKDERKSVRVCCNSEYLGIYPISWCQCKGIRLVPPPGWNRPDFLWNEYLSYCGTKAAPERLFNSGTDDHDFERGMKLEAVNPVHPNQICAATITKIIGPLLWIHMDNMKDVPSHIEDIDSHSLFPIGWCESNGIQLKPPRKSRFAKGKVKQSTTKYDHLNGEAYRTYTFSHVRSGTNGGSWCPKLFINHRCFSGPHLSKGRICELPKSVGPGPVGLVLKEVITLLIGVAYKSCRVLKELQLEGSPNPKMQRQMLKAKYKGKSYQGCIEVCRYDTQLEEFCRNICIKLECCPYLFSVLHVKDSCPENCQQLTKTKYNYNYGKKKKKPIGRPPLSSNADRGPKLGVKRGRKKKRFHLIHKKSHSTYIPKLLHGKENANRVFMNGDVKDEEFVDDERSWMDGSSNITPSKKRKYTHHLPPPSDIQTRGAKLPKYSFERKTHKKILLSSASPPLKTKTKIRQTSPQQKIETYYNGRILMPREESLQLDSNPLHWSVDRVVSFMKSTDCSHLARIIKEQEIDGQALLLMSLPVIQEHLELKLGPAVKLCHIIERLKVSFYENYA